VATRYSIYNTDKRDQTDGSTNVVIWVKQMAYQEVIDDIGRLKSNRGKDL
jgi:hypothetical protein